MRRIQQPLFVAILTLGLIHFIPTNSCLAQNTLNFDEFSIYSSLLQQRFNGDKNQELLISKETHSRDISVTKSKYFTEEFSVSKETVDDFTSCNSKPVKITAKFDLKLKVNLVGEEPFQIFTNYPEQTPKRGGWDVFKEKYPTANGFFRISRVGFNKDKTQALAYIAHHCGSLCGSGWYISW